MNYEKHYNLLIAKAVDRPKPEGYCELHHIVPKCLGGSDAPNNLALLTGREHFLAHVMLAKIHGGKLWLAVHRMAKGLDKINSKLYHASRKHVALELSKAMKDWHKANPNFQTGDNNNMRKNPNLALIHSEFMKSNNPARKPEVKAKMSKNNSGSGNPMYGSAGGMAGKKLSEEARIKISESRKKYWENKRGA